VTLPLGLSWPAALVAAVVAALRARTRAAAGWMDARLRARADRLDRELETLRARLAALEEEGRRGRTGVPPLRCDA
jgi:hypothetical protein